MRLISKNKVGQTCDCCGFHVLRKTLFPAVNVNDSAIRAEDEAFQASHELESAKNLDGAQQRAEIAGQEIINLQTVASMILVNSQR